MAPGDSLGIVGSNGSGKSTLLKILTRVMYPYAGSVAIQGRMGALIELQAGMHPDLTGRENVYLFGSLLGLSARDVDRRFDEIIAFAELDDAVNRQLKFYSSGMRMRLGFSVAAFITPNVLVVDEVLAVGDSSFQQKSLERIRWLMSQGTTVILVSHDLQSVEATCDRVIWLEEGVVRMDGTATKSLQAYRDAIEERAESAEHEGPLTYVRGVVAARGGQPVGSMASASIDMVVRATRALTGCMYVGVTQGQATPIFTLASRVDIREGENQIVCNIEQLPLPRGRFYVWATMIEGDSGVAMPWQPAVQFDVVGPDILDPPPGVLRLAPLIVKADWQATV